MVSHDSNNETRWGGGSPQSDLSAALVQSNSPKTVRRHCSRPRGVFVGHRSGGREPRYPRCSRGCRQRDADTDTNADTNTDSHGDGDADINDHDSDLNLDTDSNSYVHTNIDTNADGNALSNAN